MARTLVRILLALAALSSVALHASEGWARLKLGMSASDTLAALGHPLMRSFGKGFEIWIYDQGAEAVFYGGPLVGWTSPATSRGPARPVDVWQPGLGGPNGPIIVLPPAPPQNRGPRWIWVPSYQPTIYRYDPRR